MSKLNTGRGRGHALVKALMAKTDVSSTLSATSAVLATSAFSTSTSSIAVSASSSSFSFPVPNGASVQSSNQPTNQLETKASTSTNGADGKRYCDYCHAQFDNLPECLQHEYHKHSNQKKRRIKHKHVFPAKLSENEEDDDELRLRILDACKVANPCNAFETFIEHFQLAPEKAASIATRICSELNKILSQYGVFKILPFGSFYNGLALHDSDLDLFVMRSYHNESLPRNDAKETFDLINHALRKCSNVFYRVVAITHAKVPIIRCIEKKTQRSVDINTSAFSSIANTEFFQVLMRLDSRIAGLMLYLKIWAKRLSITGGGSRFTSYLLSTLVLHFLQTKLPNRPAILPSLQYWQKNLQPNYIEGINYSFNLRHCEFNRPPPYVRVYDMIKDFFEYFTNFDFEETIVSTYLGTCVRVCDFTSAEYYFPEYQQVKNAQMSFNNREEDLNLNKPMIVQDTFVLTRNIAAAVNFDSVRYFRMCAQASLNYCEEHLDDDCLLTVVNLIFAVKSKMLIAKSQAIKGKDYKTINATATTTSNLSVDVKIEEMKGEFPIGRKNWQSFIKKLQIKNIVPQLPLAVANILKQMFKNVLEQIFLMTVEVLNEESAMIQWQIQGRTDTWTNRKLETVKIEKTFKEQQIEQTQQMLSVRSNDANYSVALNGQLTMRVYFEKQKIEFHINHVPPKVFQKKEPLVKFFKIFKCLVMSMHLHEFID